MATSKTVLWTVLIVVEEDESLSKMFRMSPDTSLTTLMQIWRDEFNLSDNWLFVFDDGIPIDTHWMTIEMMEETKPNSKIVTLNAESFEDSVSEIFVNINEKCHHLNVQPQQKLLDVVWPLTDKATTFGYKGEPLNLKNKVHRAGLKNNAIIYESARRISVKLSSGVTTVIHMPSDSIVLQLMERVNAYETGIFSLKHQGRYLYSQERIKELTHMVEVTSAAFVVHFENQSVSWRTKSEPKTFSEFVSELSKEGDLEKKSLKNMEFICIGCQRHIKNSKEEAQLLPIKCCKEMSLTLRAMPSSDTVTNSKAKDSDQSIHSFYEHLLRCKRKDLRSGDLRRKCRIMKEECLEQDWDYNVITEWGGRLQNSFRELEDRIKILEGEIASLRTTSKRSAEEMKSLREGNKKSEEKIKDLELENDKLRDEIGTRLVIFYEPSSFTPIVHPQVEQQGKYAFTFLPHIKCYIPRMRPGWTKFEAVREFLNSLFIRHKAIRRIGQFHKTAFGMEVAAVTSRDKDEPSLGNECSYYSVAGVELSWEEAGRPQLHDVGDGGWILICGGGRRTILNIYYNDHIQ